ncbi:MAG TPA: hypothetical protein ENK49_12255, partial [Gammaproteobacteria bacterium]|nr:hypothetical protein [Gammaproteobacteria bacterium]
MKCISLFLVMVSVLLTGPLSAAPLSFPMGKQAAENPDQRPKTERLNRIVAAVNDDVVLASELDKREAMVISQLREQQAQIPDRKALRKQVL